MQRRISSRENKLNEFPCRDFYERYNYGWQAGVPSRNSPGESARHRIDDARGQAADDDDDDNDVRSPRVALVSQGSFWWLPSRLPHDFAECREERINAK